MIFGTVYACAMSSVTRVAHKPYKTIYKILKISIQTIFSLQMEGN